MDFSKLELNTCTSCVSAEHITQYVCDGVTMSPVSVVLQCVVCVVICVVYVWYCVCVFDIQLCWMSVGVCVDVFDPQCVMWCFWACVMCVRVRV